MTSSIGRPSRKREERAVDLLVAVKADLRLCLADRSTVDGEDVGDEAAACPAAAAVEDERTARRRDDSPPNSSAQNIQMVKERRTLLAMVECNGRWPYLTARASDQKVFELKQLLSWFSPAVRLSHVVGRRPSASL